MTKTKDETHETSCCCAFLVCCCVSFKIDMTKPQNVPEFTIDRKKKSRSNVTPLDQLESFTKEELITRVQQLEAHCFQLKNIIKKGGINEEPTNAAVQNQGSCKNKNRPYDFTKCTKRRIMLRMLYLGWDLDGYAVQDNSTKTIEHHLFAALTKSCLIQDRQTSNYHRCGRTDKGVSAFSQVISIDIRSRLSEADQQNLDQELQYCKMLNRLLPDEIRVLSWAPAPSAQYSARFDCNRRKYRYFFPRGCLNVEAMKQAASLLVGGHDFRNFCKMDVGNGVVDYKRSIFEADVRVVRECDQKAEGPFELCEVVVAGKAFLWHQIRCIVSVLMLVGEGREEASVVTQLLDPTQPKPQYPLASELPLVLFQCDYEEELKWQFEQEELTRVVTKMQALWATNEIKAAMIKEMLIILEPKLNEPVRAQSDSLVMGVKSKIYQPLLKRNTCSTLESKIDHYVKRRKLKRNENVSESQEGETSTVD